MLPARVLCLQFLYTNLLSPSLVQKLASHQCFFMVLFVFFSKQDKMRISSVSQENVVYSIRIIGKEVQMPYLNLGGKKILFKYKI